ncbi:amidohydrolase family protein [Myxococcota bacterium]|nr:amidohydrolase family protein [Myxococcota bacterium]
MSMRADFVIAGGLVVDGTGAPGRIADVAVRDGRIVAVGAGLEGERKIDARGRVVAPGFFDIHTHYDAQVFWDPGLTSSCWHGVTSVVAGNCGFSLAPTRPAQRRAIVRTLQAVEDMSEKMLDAGIDWRFETFGEYLALIERRGTILNYGCYVGHSPVRLFVMGDAGYEREATADEIATMREVVADSMRAGALGFASSFSANHRGDRGLPVPSRNGTKEEFVALASVLGELGYGAISYAPGVPVSWRDSYAIQPAIGRPLSWTPMLTTYPERDYKQMMKVHAEGLAQGADVHPQITCLPLKLQFRMDNPYYFRTVPIFLELLGHPPSEFKHFYRDPKWRAEAVRQVPDVKPPVVWEKFVVAETKKHAALIGRDVASLALERNCTEIDVLCDLSLDDDLETRFLVVLSNDEDGPVADLMKQPGAVFGQSDAGAHVAQLCDANMPTELLAYWVRDRKVFTLERAIRKLTSELADFFGIPDRGRIAPGAAADLVVFDLEKLDPGPLRRVRDLPGDEERLIADQPQGIEHVFVNGIAITEHGRSLVGELASRPGRILRAGGSGVDPSGTNDAQRAGGRAA